MTCRNVPSSPRCIQLPSRVQTGGQLRVPIWLMSGWPRSSTS